MPMCRQRILTAILYVPAPGPLPKPPLGSPPFVYFTTNKTTRSVKSQIFLTFRACWAGEAALLDLYMYIPIGARFLLKTFYVSIIIYVEGPIKIALFGTSDAVCLFRDWVTTVIRVITAKKKKGRERKRFLNRAFLARKRLLFAQWRSISSSSIQYLD